MSLLNSVNSAHRGLLNGLRTLSQSKLIAIGSVAAASFIFGTGALFSRFGYPYRLFHSVQKDSPNDAGYLVAQVLKAHKVNFVFTLCGGHISPILVGCEKLGIRVIDTRHEATAVFAADAVARLTGSIGVAAVTAGPGVTNTVTAVKNAQMAESPVLILGGAAATLLKGRGALQDIEQLALMASVCKWSVTVKRVRDVVPTLRRAIHVAMSGTPGPVFVELPIDVLYSYALVKEGLALDAVEQAHARKWSLGGAISIWYLNHYLNNLFAGAWEPRPFSPIPLKTPLPSSSTVAKCARLLQTAKRPVLVVGSQATLPPCGIEVIAQAVQQLRVPCWFGGMARGLLGASQNAHDNLQFIHNRKNALREADLIILAGVAVDFRLNYGRDFNKSAKIITVSRNRERIAMNSPIVWKPAEIVLGDVGTFLVQLSKEFLRTAKNPDAQWAEWYTTLRERELKREIEIKEKQALVKPERHLNSVQLMLEVNKRLSPKSMIIADGGDFVGTAAYTLRPRGPLCWLDPGAYGTLGCGAGFALGAKLCRPEHDVWIVFGDGSLGYSLSEFDTFVRHKLPLLAVVGTDACWTQIYRDQTRLLKSEAACTLAYTNYEQAAAGLGAKGLLLDTDKAPADAGEDIARQLDEALALARSGNPVLLNCFIGRSSFREGSLSV